MQMVQAGRGSMGATILGFCRFSFFGPSDTKIDYSDRDEAHRTLYAPERMETRFHLFENLMLPGVAAQTDKDFRLVVVTSSTMPAPYRARLADLVAGIPQIELVVSEETRLAHVLRPYVTDPEIAGQGLLQFRCDDDDGMSRHYIARLRRWLPALRDRMIVTFPRGLMLYRDGKGPQLHTMYRNLTGAGYAHYTAGPTPKNVFGYSHINSGRRFPFISDPGFSSYIQSFTATSDTAFRAERKIRQFQKATGIETGPRAAKFVEEALADDFNYLSEDGLKQLLLRAEGVRAGA